MNQIGYKTYCSIYCKNLATHYRKIIAYVTIKEQIVNTLGIKQSTLTFVGNRPQAQTHCGSHAGTTQSASFESVSLRRLVVGNAVPAWARRLIGSNRSNRLKAGQCHLHCAAIC